MGIFDALTDTGNIQGEGLGTLGQNPLFNIGMGLLSSRYDSSINPFQAAIQGAQRAVDAQSAAKDRAYQATQRELEEKERQRQAKAREDVVGLLGGMTAPGHPGLGDGPGADMTAADRQIMSQYAQLAELDPAAALRGATAYQQRQQLAGQGSQAQTRSKTPFIGADGIVRFPDSSEPSGFYTPTDAEGKPFIGKPDLRTMQLSDGTVIQVDERQANKIIELRTAQEAAESQEDVADVVKQRTALRGLPGLESDFMRPGGTFDLLTRIMSPEMEEMREKFSGKSSMLARAQAMVPGSAEASFSDLMDQINSTAFIEGIAALRQKAGSIGPITDVEGAKIQDSYFKARNAQSKEEFEMHYGNMLEASKNMMRAARREAGVDVDIPFIEGGVDFRDPATIAAQEEKEAGEQQSRYDALREKYNLPAQ